MTGFIRRYDQLRAQIWLRQTMCDFGVDSPGALESLLRRYDRMAPESSSNLKKIANGKALPFHSRGGSPYLYRCAWPDRADAILEAWRAARSGSDGHTLGDAQLKESVLTDGVDVDIDRQLHRTSFAAPEAPHRRSLGTRWLKTPFWYLLEGVPIEATLRECIALLPKMFQEDLLEPKHPDQTGPAGLAFIARSCVYVFTDPLGPEALGALACARHRARIAGDLGAERWCNVGLVWALMAMERQSGRQLKPQLELLTDVFLLHAAAHVYVSGIQVPIQSQEVERFHREREAFMAWTVEGQIAAGETPTWLEC